MQTTMPHLYKVGFSFLELPHVHFGHCQTVKQHRGRLRKAEPNHGGKMSTKIAQAHHFVNKEIKSTRFGERLKTQSKQEL